MDYKIIPLDQFKPGKDSLPETLFVSYGRDRPDIQTKKQIHIYASDLFGKDYLKPASLPQTPLKKYNGLPVIYSGHGDFKEWVKKSAGLIETNVDIIASAFFMLSRYEEVVLAAHDVHNRFPATASIAYKEGFLDMPIVNEYIEFLRGWIESLAPKSTNRHTWPGDKKFAICLTHDVDRLQMYRLSFMAGAALDKIKLLLMPKTKRINPKVEGRLSSLNRVGVKDALNIMCDWTKVMLKLKKDPFDTFDYMLNLEREHGFNSSFYFMAGGNSRFDKRYSISDPLVIKLIRQIEANDNETGLHGSYNSYNNPEQLSMEKSRLDKVASNRDYGCRQHYLRWKTPDSWRTQEKAGLLYDATLSFADHAGFRCGICMPFQPFDLVENRKLDIWELPLTVMEGSLRGYSYQNLTPETAYEQIVKYIDTVKRFNGVLVLLWHNSSINSPGKDNDWKEVYERVMKYMKEQYAWVTSGRQIIDWWHGLCSARYKRNVLQ